MMNVSLWGPDRKLPSALVMSLLLRARLSWGPCA
jgi:hypothetical protein